MLRSLQSLAWIPEYCCIRVCLHNADIFETRKTSLLFKVASAWHPAKRDVSHQDIILFIFVNLSTTYTTTNSHLSGIMSCLRGVVANYLAAQARDPGINSHLHQNDSWHIWHHMRKDIVSSCNLRCWLIFLYGRSRTYLVASLRAGPVGRILYNLYLWL